MSGPDRQRAADRKLRTKRTWSADEVFATMRADFLLDALLRHARHGAAGRTAVRALLLAHAAWLPGAGGLTDGEAVLPYKLIRHPMPEARARGIPSPGKATVRGGLEMLLADEDLTLARAGTAPRRAGGGRGEAAIYRVPARHGTEAPRLEWRWDLRRPNGSVRLHVQRIRHDCAVLSPIALCLLVLAITQHDRQRDGSLASNAPFPLFIEQVAELLGVSEAAVSVARDELVETGRLILHAAAHGRQPTMFRLAAVYAKRLAPRATATGKG